MNEPEFFYYKPVVGKLASLNLSWQGNKGTFSALGQAGIEPMPSEPVVYDEHRHRHTDTDRQTHTDRHRHTQTQTHTNTHTHVRPRARTHTHTHTHTFRPLLIILDLI